MNIYILNHFAGLFVDIAQFLSQRLLAPLKAAQAAKEAALAAQQQQKATGMSMYHTWERLKAFYLIRGQTLNYMIFQDKIR